MVPENNPILGTFVGKCADGNITNENGMDITREVWTYLFNSDDYKRGIENGWYIGLLGHPDDPGDQHHQEGCIIMRKGWIDDNDEVYGEFDLIDTPVGKIVKTFIDAGVQFGISVRGAGDLIGSQVQPETFVFRGFDLVIFPAWKDCIPTFTAIAASTDIEQQKKYKTICAAVKSQLPYIKSCEALDEIQSQFSKQSDMYRDIEDAKCTLANEFEPDLKDEKIKALTDLYLEEKCKGERLEEQLSVKDSAMIDFQASQNDKMSRQIKAATRILKDQITLLSSQNEKLTIQNKQLIVANRQMKKDLTAVTASVKLQSDYEDKTSTIQHKHIAAIQANKQLKNQLANLEEENLNLKQKITSSKNLKEGQDSKIRSLNSKLAETVRESKKVEEELSNRDTEISELKSDIKCALDLVSDYQDAYAKLYSMMIGCKNDHIQITSTTTVEELKKIIASTSSDSHSEPIKDIDVVDSDCDSIVTV